MRYLLFTLSLAWLPLAIGQSHQYDEQHDSLGAHEHGVAQLDVALEGRHLELELHSPALNLLGFEHAPRGSAEWARVEAVRAVLEQPGSLFGLAAAAQCTVTRQAVNSPMFSAADGDSDHLALHDEEPDAAGQTAEQHSEFHALYQLQCTRPGAVRLDLSSLFRRYPGMRSIQVQLIGPKGQHARTLNSSQPLLEL